MVCWRQSSYEKRPQGRVGRRFMATKWHPIQKEDWRQLNRRYKTFYYWFGCWSQHGKERKMERKERICWREQHRRRRRRKRSEEETREKNPSIEEKEDGDYPPTENSFLLWLWHFWTLTRRGCDTVSFLVRTVAKGYMVLVLFCHKAFFRFPFVPRSKLKSEPKIGQIAHGMALIRIIPRCVLEAPGCR